MNISVLLRVAIAAGADGGDLLWQSEGDSTGLGQIVHLTEHNNRPLAVGYAVTVDGRGLRPLVRAYAAETGALLWSHQDGSPRSWK